MSYRALSYIKGTFPQRSFTALQR